MSPGHGRASYSDTPTETPPSASAHLTSGRDLASEPSVSSLHSAFSGMTLTDHLKGRLHLGSESIRNDTPSETSISDDEEDLRTDEVDEGLRRWASKRKGKDKAQEEEREEGLAADLPAEVLMQILRLLQKPGDLYSALQVSRQWCLAGFSLLWSRPTLTSPTQLAKFTRVLQSSDPSLPYPSQVRRLNLGALSSVLSDELVEGLQRCDRVERLTISNAEGISSGGLKKLIGGMKNVNAIDLSGTSGVVDSVIQEIADKCENLQCINVGNCNSVGDQGLKALADKQRIFRRVKVGHCHRLTDASMVPLIQNCPLIVDLDITSVPQLTNASLYSIFLHSAEIRELRLNFNANINDEGIPNLPELCHEIANSPSPDLNSIPWYAQLDGMRITPVVKSFDFLRVVDLTSCSAMNDQGIANLIANVPKIRHLTLTKCPLLTDAALESIVKLGKNLHHLHLGHCVEITDVGVLKIARSCTRIRYLDLACCNKLTDESIVEVAVNMEKLKRIGLVKVTKITDETVCRLVARRGTLERIHLSYCDKISVRGIRQMLNGMDRLTHLSLTAVTAFKTAELQQFCRPVPSEYSTNQRDAFCVYSDRGIPALRKYLNIQHATNSSAGVTSDEGSRRNSESSTSSLNTPGRYSPPHHAPSSISPMDPHRAMYATQQWMLTAHPFGRTGETSRGAFTTAHPPPRLHSRSSANALGERGAGRLRRTSRDVHTSQGNDDIPAPVFRYAGSRRENGNRHAQEEDITLPGLPGTFLAASSPNFLAPTPIPSSGSVSWTSRFSTGSSRQQRSTTTERTEAEYQSSAGGMASGSRRENTEGGKRGTSPGWMSRFGLGR